MFVAFSVTINVVLANVRITNTAPTYDDVMQLNQDLLKNYSRQIRPVMNQGDSVVVSTRFIFKGLSNYDELSGAFTIICGFKCTWRDEKIAWNPRDYGNLSEVVLPSFSVWVPVLYLVNTADSMEMKTDVMDVYFWNNGRATATTGLSISSLCSPNTRQYPFDRQECVLKFITMRKSTEIMIFSDGWDVIESEGNPKWEVLNVQFQNETFEDTPCLKVEITMKRRPEFLIVTLILPIIILSFVNLFVFLLPVESGERVSFSITVLLSFTVYITMISDNMPHSSINMSRLCIYLLSTLIYSCFVALVTIFSLRVHFTEDFESLPALLRYCTIKTLKSKGKVTQINIPALDEKAMVNVEDCKLGRSSHNDPEKIKAAGKLLDFVFLFLFLVANATVIGLFFMEIV